MFATVLELALDSKLFEDINCSWHNGQSVKDYLNSCLPEFCTALDIAVVIYLLLLTQWPMRL